MHAYYNYGSNSPASLPASPRHARLGGVASARAHRCASLPAPMSPIASTRLHPPPPTARDLSGHLDACRGGWALRSVRPKKGPAEAGSLFADAASGQSASPAPHRLRTLTIVPVVLNIKFSDRRRPWRDESAMSNQLHKTLEEAIANAPFEPVGAYLRGKPYRLSAREEQSTPSHSATSHRCRTKGRASSCRGDICQRRYGPPERVRWRSNPS